MDTLPYGINKDWYEVIFVKTIMDNDKLSDHARIYLMAKEIHRLTRNNFSIRSPKVSKVYKKLRKDKLVKNSISNKLISNRDELYALALTDSKYFYKSKYWKQFRFYVLSKSEKICSTCGSSKDLHVSQSRYEDSGFELGLKEKPLKEKPIDPDSLSVFILIHIK